MAQYKIAVLPGDGIGKEITREGVKVLQAVEDVLGKSMSFEFEHFDAGAERFLKTGVAMPEGVFDQCRAADAIFMGAIGLPEARHPDGREVNGDVIFKLRFDLDLYAGVRPVKLLPGIPGPLRNISKGIDYVVVRENIEGLYASRNGGCNVRDEVVTDTIIVTRTGTKKIVDYAFRLARRRGGRPLDGRKIVTCVDKANVLKSYAFFRKVFNEVAEGYTDVGTECIYVDAMTAYQVLCPERFDVLVAENMFGDIISDLSSATVGGLGLAPSGDIGDGHGLFQSAHGSAPDIAGKDIANPIATILSAAMLLDWLGDTRGDSSALDGGRLIRDAVDHVLEKKEVRTPDIGGSSRCTDMGDTIAAKIRGER
jgi:3-isopropylmalate dehydrogenase